MKRNIRKIQLLEANAEEDKVIESLEKALKLKKRKKKKNKNLVPTQSKAYQMFTDDGLDYILGVTDLTYKTDNLAVSGEQDICSSKNEGFGRRGTKRTYREEQEVQDPNRDVERKVLKYGKKVHAGSESHERDLSNFICHGEDRDTKSCDASETCLDVVEEKAEDSNILQKNIKDELKVGKTSEDNNNKTAKVYVPPSRCLKFSGSGEDNESKLLKIRSRLKGLINRASESNMRAISYQIEELYMQNSRNDMNKLLYSNICDLVITSSAAPQRLIMEQALLVALIHVNTGLEVGSFFLHELVLKLDGLLKCGGSYGEGKLCDNLLHFLVELYHFKVCSCILIFDVLKLLANSFQDKDIELILSLLETAGCSLRKDNPLKMKEVLQLLQTKASSVQHNTGSRVQFMLDTLTALRNNNFNKLSSSSSALREHLKKVFKSSLRSGSSLQELFLSFDDILKTGVNNGPQIPSSACESNLIEDKQKELTKQALQEREVDFKILQLAYDQHMNTGMRKAIFCVIMAAEDYLDAFEKLLHLDAKNQLGQEIMNIIIHCTLREKTFNPYYAFLAGKFCRFARKYQTKLQFSLWDKFKVLNQFKQIQIRNLASFIVQLLLKEDLPISILKVIPFSDMNQQYATLLEQIFRRLLLHDSQKELMNIFKRLATRKNLNTFKEGIRLFMVHFLLQSEQKLHTTTQKILKGRVELVEKMLKSTSSGDDLCL